MLTDLARHSHDTTDLRDRLPYVLDLLAGVSRTVDTESRGHRRPAFAAWWGGVDRSAQQTIHEMRNAELKEFVSRTALLVNDGDTVTTISWAFNVPARAPLTTRPASSASSTLLDRCRVACSDDRMQFDFTTRASPEQVLRALTEFTEVRLETWNRTLDPEDIRAAGERPDLGCCAGKQSSITVLGGRSL
jgi:hypothetical protein